MNITWETIKYFLLNFLLLLLLIGLIRYFLKSLPQSSIIVKNAGETYIKKAFVLKGLFSFLFKFFLFLGMCFILLVFLALNLESEMLKLLVTLSIYLLSGVTLLFAAYQGIVYKTLHHRTMTFYGNWAVFVGISLGLLGLVAIALFFGFLSFII